MDKTAFKLFQRQMILEEVGFEGQQKLLHSSVLVIGAGGIGCPAFTYLQRAGIQTLGIADFDTVDITNIHRQFLYDLNDEGKAKVQVIKEKIKPYPGQNLVFFYEKITSENLSSILKPFQLVIDGTDNFTARYAINDACASLNIPLITASILGFQIQLFVFDNPKQKNLRTIFPEPPLPHEVPACAENGVLGTIAGMAGIWTAHEAIKLLLNRSYLKDEFLIWDGLTMEGKKVVF